MSTDAVKSKRLLPPWLPGLAVGLVLWLGKADVAVPTAVPLEDAILAGTVRFAEPDANSLRRYTVSLDEVPAPPDGLHYERWFAFANQTAAGNVAEVVVGNGRITYADVLVDNLAISVTSALISLEPDVDDDPAISDEVAYRGVVQPESGLAEIVMTL